MPFRILPNSLLIGCSKCLPGRSLYRSLHVWLQVGRLKRELQWRLPGFLVILPPKSWTMLRTSRIMPDQLVPSPEIATNLATSLIFVAFHELSQMQNTEKARRSARIFSQSGFDATCGQHRDLLKTPSTVEGSLSDYWEMIILKSGSVFRTATAGGAAAGTSDDRLIDALGDYGTALGVMLQLIDDCRDVLNQSQDITDWEISLPSCYICSPLEKSISASRR